MNKDLDQIGLIFKANYDLSMWLYERAGVVGAQGFEPVIWRVTEAFLSGKCIMLNMADPDLPPTLHILALPS